MQRFTLAAVVVWIFFSVPAGRTTRLWGDDTLPSREDVPVQGIIDVAPAATEVLFGFNRLRPALQRLDQVRIALGSSYSLLDLLSFEEGFVGRDIIDQDGPAAILGLTPFDIDGSFQRLAVLLAVQDPQAARERLQAPAGLEDGEVFPGSGQLQSLSLLFVQNMLVILGSQATASDCMGDRLAGRLPEEERQRLADADVVTLLGRGKLMEEFLQDVFGIDQVDQPREPDGEVEQRIRQTIRQLASGLEWITIRTTAAFDPDRETPTGMMLGSSLLFGHDPQSEAAELLASLGGEGRVATLTGLPEGNVLFALAGQLHDESTLVTLRSLLDTALTHRYRRFDPLQFPFAQHFLAVFEEVGSHVESGRMAVYSNHDQNADGHFSVILILDSSDPTALLTDLRQLIRLATPEDVADAGREQPLSDEEIRQLVTNLGDRVFRVRQAATNRLILLGPRAKPFVEEALQSDSLERRTRAEVILERIAALNRFESREFFGSDLLDKLDPEFRYVIAGESLADGTSLDWIDLKLSAENEAFAQQLRVWFGPEWHRWRLAVQEQRVVLMIGSHQELLSETLHLTSATEGGRSPGLRIPCWNREETAYQFECHLDLNLLPEDLRRSRRSEEEPTFEDSGLTSLGLVIDRESIRFDLFIPLSQLYRTGFLFWF